MGNKHCDHSKCLRRKARTYMYPARWRRRSYMCICHRRDFQDRSWSCPVSPSYYPWARKLAKGPKRACLGARGIVSVFCRAATRTGACHSVNWDPYLNQGQSPLADRPTKFHRLACPRRLEPPGPREGPSVGIRPLNGRAFQGCSLSPRSSMHTRRRAVQRFY